MAVNTLRAPTGVMDTIRDTNTGVRYISFDGLNWQLYQVNEDNIEATSTAGSLTDAQRAQLIAQRNVPDGTTGTVSTGTWLRYTEGSTMAYRLILSTGASTYSLTEPT